MITSVFRRTALVACGAVVLLGVGPSSVLAVTVEAGGSPLASGTQIGAPLSGVATLTATGGSVTCSTGSMGGFVGASGGASVVVTGQTFTLGPAAGAVECVNSGFPYLVRDFTLSSIGSSTFSTGKLSLTSVKLAGRITSGGLPGSCNFDAPSAVGQINNVNHTVAFTNVSVTSTSGFCSALSPATLTANFAPIKTVTGGSPVTVT